jgi:hypothetical protein
MCLQYDRIYFSVSGTNVSGALMCSVLGGTPQSSCDAAANAEMCFADYGASNCNGCKRGVPF